MPGAGPLRQFAPGFIAELARLGYTADSASGQMFLMTHLSRWLAAQGLDVAGLTPQVAARFLAARRAAGYTMYSKRISLVIWGIAHASKLGCLVQGMPAPGQIFL
jgi:hypothetical protein